MLAFSNICRKFATSSWATKPLFTLFLYTLFFVHVVTPFSLFPEYSVLETGRNEAQAMRLAQQLREVDLQMLVTDPDRRNVVARLRREGIDNAMQLILLTEEEVLGWPGVGPVFVTILAEMRRQVVAHPERTVDTWHNVHRLLVLPDDLDVRNEEDDFFGLLIDNPEQASGPASATASASASAAPATSPSALASASASAAPAASIEPRLAQYPPAEPALIVELERCIIAAIEMLEHRWEAALALRRYYIDGLPADAIVDACRLASPAALFRITGHLFRDPFMRGYAVKGVQLSDTLVSRLRGLRKSLIYSPAAVLGVLRRMPAQRFLEFLGLTLMQRTQAEAFWGGDYIVPDGAIERCRRTQRDLFSALQFRVVAVKESSVRRSIQQLRHGRPGLSGAVDPAFLRVLLKGHPCIESSAKGYRLVSERLNYDCARLARIVYDAHGPIALADILAQYERRYMQRPQRVSIAHVRARFPQVHSISRGIWRWK